MGPDFAEYIPKGRQVSKHTHSSEFGPDVQDHDHRHSKGNDVDEGRSALENDGVGQLDIPRIAVGYDAGGT